ncbi:MAG: sigma-70 family RNA polymerase sigma factor [Arachidicoccus sp.]|nr:sigma-70 family RNA polymerase sigma factor [Arachidicoccus sp.]
MNLTQIFTERILPLKDTLLRLAFSMVRQAEEAEDIVQDVLLKIWDKRDEWIKLHNYEGYCMAMTRNLCIDKIRKNKQSFQPLDNISELQTADKNPYESAVNKEAIGCIQSSMQQLPEMQFLAIQLRETEGKSYQEIATLLGISLEQVKVNIHRARTTIKQQLIKQLNHGL